MKEKLHDKLKKSLNVGVFGSDGDHCSETVKDLAYAIGKEIAERGHIVLTGGGNGVMEAANKGASDAGGISIGILPGAKKEEANPYCSLVIPTEIGYARGQILANTVDAAIAIEGSWGTHHEIAVVNYLEKPVVVIAGSGGTADELIGKVIDERRNKPSVYSAKTARDAVTILEADLRNGISDVEEMLRVSQSHVAPYTTKVFGRTIWVDPDVCSPKYSNSARFFIENWDIEEGQRVLDMGTGSGVLALFAAFAGAEQVVASDINPKAYDIARRNVEHHGLQEEVEVLQGDLFSPVEGKFDRILFNLPYWNRKPSTELERAFFDDGYQVLTSFFEGARNYLSDGGRVLLSFSEQGDVRFLEDTIASNNYQVKRKIRKDNGHVRLLYFLE